MRNLFFTILFVAIGNFAVAEQRPAPRDDKVNDFAELLTVSEEAQLTERIAKMGRTDLRVITINSMSDYGFHGSFEQFATNLFNKWQIGSLPENDGIMLLVSVRDRKVRIEVGAGYGSSQD